MQIVDPTLVINPINPNYKDSNIITKGEIFSIMIKLGVHVKISGNGSAVNRKKIWDWEGGRKSRSSRKTTKKEELHDPTLYFNIII
jgi:hypothetical protein